MNMRDDCDNLDAFLLGDLGGDEAARFEQHVTTCAACRGAIDEQRWLDGLLRSPVRAELEPPPDALVESIRDSVTRRRKQRRLLAYGLAVAAGLVVAAGWTLWAGQRHGNPIGQIAETAGGSPAARPQPPGQSQPREAEHMAKAIVVGGKNTIAVPVESHYPNVTVVRMYPVYQPNYAAGGVPWPEPINGG
jgi:anti-sigma factor RsiW